MTFPSFFAVELDDKSHNKQGRQDRDEFLGRAMEAAGVPLFHFQAKKGYSIQEVWNELSSKLEITDTDEGAEKIVSEQATDASVEPIETVKLCPSCGGDMIMRKAKKGENVGQEFWGCSNYPKCRIVLPIQR